MLPPDDRLPGPEPGLLECNDLPALASTGVWLDDLELYVGAPMGTVDGIEPLRPTTRRSPRQALEEIVLVALQRPPCIVTFSGGRDSSTVLAIASHVARREQLPLPIPVTNRFLDDPEANEDEWQEGVVRHLRLDDWQRLTWTDELDALGPYARRSLRATGLGAPFNQHFILPMIDLAAGGGSVLTGMGGDELFIMPARRIANRVRYDRSTASWQDARGFLAQQVPRRFDAWRTARSEPIQRPWLKRSVSAPIQRRVADSASAQPVRYDRALARWWWPARMNQLSREQLRRLAATQDVALEHPFTTRGFLAALAGQQGPVAPRGRARMLRAMVGDLLAPDILARTSKAAFDRAFANTWTRDFVEHWSGTGLDPSAIDVDELRKEWQKPEPHAGTYLLLQAAWLSDTERGHQ